MTAAHPAIAQSVVSPARAVEKARPADRPVKRERPVDVDFAELDSRAAARGGALALELFDGMTITVDADSVDVRGARNYTLFGRIRGYARSNAVLTVVDGHLAAQLTLGETPGRGHGAAWRIQGDGHGHWLQELDPDAFPPDHPTGGPSLHAPPPTKSDRDDAKAQVAVAADSGATIDLMVVYSNQTALAAGAAIGSQIQSAVDVANQAYARSLIGTQLRLVHYAQINYDESGDFYTDLQRLTSTADGHMDSAHTLRNTHAADLVSLFIENGSYCGMAWIGASAGYAFSVVNRGCAAGNHTLAHELGHNYGARHDPYVDAATTPYAWGHGYVDVVGRWRTVMAYADACAAAGVSCARIGHFSNPDVFYGGRPTGSATTSDNARVHDERAYTIANFRASGGGGGGGTCTVSLSPTSVSVPASGATGTVSVSSSCGWTATSAASWLTITSGASGSGNGSVGYSAAANAGAARASNVTIGGASFTVSQGAATNSASAALSTTSLPFGNVQLGRTSSAKSATFTNTGNVALSIASLAMSGAAPVDYLRSGSCSTGLALQPGQSCSMSLVFAPTATGSRTANLSVTTAAGTQTLSLSGNGKAARGGK